MAHISDKIVYLAAGTLLGMTCYMAWKHPEKLRDFIQKAQGEMFSNDSAEMKSTTQKEENNKSGGEEDE